MTVKKHLLLWAAVAAFAILYLKSDAGTGIIVGLAAVIGLFVLRFGLSQTRAGRAMRVRNPFTGRLAKKRPGRDRRELDDRPAILYITTHRRFNAIKVGIGDDSGRRLEDHEGEGWQIRRVYTGLNRGAAFAAEQEILRHWRRRGWAGYVPADYMPQGGHTETASLDQVPLDSVIEHADKILRVKRRGLLRRRKATVGLAA